MNRKYMFCGVVFSFLFGFFNVLCFSDDNKKVQDNFIGIWVFDVDKTIENDERGTVWNELKKETLKNNIDGCIADIKVNGDIIYTYNDGTKITAEHKIVKSTPQELVLEGVEVPGNTFTLFLLYVDKNYLKKYSMIQPFHKDSSKMLKLYFKRKLE